MFTKQNIKNVFFGLSLILILAIFISAQTKRKTSGKKIVKKPVPVQTQPIAEETPSPEVKKNVRPEAENHSNIEPERTSDAPKTNSRPVAKVETKPIYFYEFSQPNFYVSKIKIEHDENGKGKITFIKKDFAEEVTDPVQLSPMALERVKAVWQQLNFLDSTENYQFEKDYSHLGTMKFAMKKDGREREATFNWTANKDAKNLADEYRRISQQFIWIFDINVARENQPLEAPRMFDTLDSYIRRNEVSDGEQMIPLLKELSNDERVPLIGRNHATKIIAQIEKKKADKK